LPGNRIYLFSICFDSIIHSQSIDFTEIAVASGDGAENFGSTSISFRNYWLFFICKCWIAVSQDVPTHWQRKALSGCWTILSWYLSSCLPYDLSI